MVNWTEEQYRDYLSKRFHRDVGFPVPSSVPSLKYRNEKTQVDGHVFDSAREADVYRGLVMAERSGVISSLRLQPRYLLQEGFRDRDGRYIRPVYYVADFCYVDRAGHTVVVDVKSKVTEANAVYRLKRKLFLYRYPELLFREVF